MTSKAQQIELDNALVAPENRRVIGKCNMRINPGMKLKEPTYQVALDALALTTCYPAFLITAEVPVIYMHQFWATFTKHKSSYRLKIDNKKVSVNLEVFRHILNICPRIQGQEFDEPPTEEEALSFIRELGHSGEIKCITNVSGLDNIRLSRVQILYGMYYKKNLDFVALIWEDLAYQIDNMDSKKQDKMFYPRFTKIIIHHFLDKDKSISMRNKTFMHTARDDSLLGTMRFVSRHADTQVYGVILPETMTNQALLNSVAYKTYYGIASGAEPPRSRKSQKKSDSAISSKESPSKKKFAKAEKVAATKPKPTQKKAPVKADRGKGLNVLLEVAITNFESGVPDEQHRKTSGIDEGTSTIPGVPDVPKYDSESNDKRWPMDDDDDDANDDDNQEDDDTNDDDEETDSDRTESDRIKIPVLDQDADMTDADQGGADQQNVSQESGFEQVEEDAHVTLTPVLDTQKTDEPVQSSSVSSDFTSKLLNLENPSPADNEIASLMDTTARHATTVPEITSVFTTTIPPPPPFFNPLPQQATPTPTPTTSEATTSFPSLLDFSSVFKFNDRVTNLEKDLSEIKQVDQYAQALSSIPAIVDRYIDNKLGEAIQKAIMAHNLDCREEDQAEKRDYIELVDTSIRAIDPNP
ncbi:hypothetical protein Tco_0242037 [Tanacetum coccineum]